MPVAVETLKVCSACGLDKSAAEFPWKNRERGQRNGRCKPCHRVAVKASEERHREAVKARHRTYHEQNRHARNADRRDRYDSAHARDGKLRSQFGISLEQYNEMLSRQGGACAICERPESALAANGEPRALAVDHDHDTGAVRGLLCAACNVALGAFGDDPARLRTAAAYIENRR